MCNLRGAGYDIPGVSLPKIQPKIAAFSFMLLSTELDNQEKSDEKASFMFIPNSANIPPSLLHRSRHVNFNWKVFPKH